MGLRDQIAGDLAVLMGNTDHTEPCTLYPGDSVTGIAVRLIVGQPGDTLVIGATIGQRDEKRLVATGDRGTLQAAIQTITGTARDMQHGDRLVFAAGHSQAGEWRVDTTRPDPFGWIQADCVSLNTVRAGDPALLRGG